MKILVKLAFELNKFYLLVVKLYMQLKVS